MRSAASSARSAARPSGPKAAVIQAEVRDARLRLLADDLVQLTSTLEQEVADETALIARRTEVEDGLAGVAPGRRARGGARGRAPSSPEPRTAGSAPAEPARAAHRTGSLATERVRLLCQDTRSPGRRRGATPRSCAQAAEARRHEAALLVEVPAPRTSSRPPSTRRAEAEQAYAAEQQRLARVARAVADRREGLAQLAGQVAAGLSRIEAARPRSAGSAETVAPPRPGRPPSRSSPRWRSRRRRGGRRGGPRRGLRARPPPPRPGRGRARAAPGPGARRGARPATSARPASRPSS